MKCSVHGTSYEELCTECQEKREPLPVCSNSLLERPIQFGLFAQGKIGYVGKMLAEGKSFRWIAATISWEPETLKRHWLLAMDQL
jgi:hypothetical protein